MIRQETIVRILLESEIGSIENDGTRSMAGHINRTQYHDVADKILKLVVQPDVIKSVCDHRPTDLDVITDTVVGCKCGYKWHR